ncbi:MAG: hypothetical protein BWZ08_00094 [candidate division BRC1 bacterium ADurb.BinA292]|nr:MAG: hypothetical protein BWZ08_00094 [candidate division BRC1 bacterium ADurb.BinA292]
MAIYERMPALDPENVGGWNNYAEARGEARPDHPLLRRALATHPADARIQAVARQWGASPAQRDPA